MRTLEKGQILGSWVLGGPAKNQRHEVRKDTKFNHLTGSQANGHRRQTQNGSFLDWVATGNPGFSSIFNIENFTKFSREEEEEAELVEFIVEKKNPKNFPTFFY